MLQKIFDKRYGFLRISRVVTKQSLTRNITVVCGDNFIITVMHVSIFIAFGKLCRKLPLCVKYDQHTDTTVYGSTREYLVYEVSTLMRITSRNISPL